MMMQRLLGTVIAAAFACVAIAPLSAQSQAAAKPSSKDAKSGREKAWTLPRTSDGHPDFQGIWSNATNKPLERPKELGTKEFYTEQEFAEVSKKGFLGDRGGPQEVHYDFSQYGMDALQNRFAPDLRTSLIVGPEGRIPPMTPEAIQRNAARAAKAKGHEFDSVQNRSVTERCLVYGGQEGPPMLPPMYNNNMEIVQSPGYVGILNEMYHDARMIPTDGRPHIPDSVRQWRGDSRGRWEGDTLVVDTTNFTDRTAFRGSSEYLRVVERFTRTGPDTIVYRFTVEDPHTWAKPWTAELVMGPANGEVYEFACHEGNYGLPNILSGARAEEKAAAEAKSAK
ncbi:MAG TPA: hypothetical protein VGR73_11960 [Bryobacteraceae bacterium]|nr:hypothetical protein [Bryobacteraceae bacterium]